jgi:hypothetical protein
MVQVAVVYHSGFGHTKAQAEAVARGAASVAASAVVLFGGYLGMFTGYGKAIAEVALLTAAVAVFGLRVIRPISSNR